MTWEVNCRPGSILACGKGSKICTTISASTCYCLSRLHLALVTAWGPTLAVKSLVPPAFLAVYVPGLRIYNTCLRPAHELCLPTPSSPLASEGPPPDPTIPERGTSYRSFSYDQMMTQAHTSELSSLWQVSRAR